LCVGLSSVPALAYRPFDGTDAAVADLGKIEVELQPFGALQAGPVTTFVAPQTVINFGFAQDWEAVLQGQLESDISPSRNESLTANGFFLKHVVRPGVLQDQTGPSIATEFGVIPPNINAGPFFIKPTWTWIISDRFPWGTMHLNFTANFMSDPRTDFFLDIILEGPAKWTVRPVAEFYSDSMIDGPQIYSALVGAIWQVNEDLSFDVAIRHATAGRVQENEVRAGVTIALPTPELATPAKALPPGRALH